MNAPDSRYASGLDFIRQHKPETPVYCLSPKDLEAQVQRFTQGFPGTVGYAVKANPEALLIDALIQAGVNTFDVASIAEVTLIRGKLPGAHLLYDNPIKSKAEIREAYEDYGVRSFAIDDALELEKIAAIAGDDSSLELTVRFKIADATAVYDLSSKFGADETTCIQLMQKVRQRGYRCSLTFHPGSQCTDPLSYRNYIAKAAEIVAQAGVDIDMLNVGGGFPTPYLEAKIPELGRYFEIIRQAWLEFFPQQNSLLVCEPGRALVDPAVSLIARVKHRREHEDTVFLNDGIYGAFMEQVWSPIELPIHCYRGGKKLNGTRKPFVAWGPTCDSIDKFAFALPLVEEIAEGDWLEFGLMGGYGSSTATRFNGFSSEHYIVVEQGFDYESVEA